MADEKKDLVSEEHDTILRLARKRMDASVQGESEYRKDAIIDRKFNDGDQWPEFVRKKRKSRVVATVNKTRIMRNNVVGAAMDINIKPIVEPKKGSDVEKAKIYDAIMTDIYEKSKASRVNRSALKDSTTSGMGFIKIVPEWDETGFYQHLVIKHITNPLTVYSDTTATEFLYDDERFKFITGVMSEEEFQDEYPNAKTNMSSIQTGWGDNGKELNWHDQEGIVVAEYYYKVPQTVKRAQMVTGEVFELSDEVTEELITSTTIPGTINPETGEGQTYEIAEIKDFKEWTVKWAKITGMEVLEGPIDLKIPFIPVVPILGYDENINGKRVHRGIVYDIRDPQRMYNYHYSSEAEIIANQAKAPYIMFDDMLDVNQRPAWDNLGTSNPSYLTVKRTAGNVLPRREQPPMSSSGNINYMARADNDMKDVTGIFSSAIGKQDNARSKVAIDARKIASNTNTRILVDNWVEGILEVGKRVLAYIKVIYDTEQTVFIKGEDGEQIPVVVNQTVFDPKTKKKVILNDLKEGQYDYVLQPGSEGLTSRQEQLIALQEFTQNLPPEIKVMFADKFAELANMSPDIVQRMKEVVQGLSQQQQEQPTGAQIENA